MIPKVALRIFHEAVTPLVEVIDDAFEGAIRILENNSIEIEEISRMTLEKYQIKVTTYGDHIVLEMRDPLPDFMNTVKHFVAVYLSRNNSPLNPNKIISTVGDYSGVIDEFGILFARIGKNDVDLLVDVDNRVVFTLRL